MLNYTRIQKLKIKNSIIKFWYNLGDYFWLPWKINILKLNKNLWQKQNKLKKLSLLYFKLKESVKSV